MHGEIRRSRFINVFAAFVVVFLSAGVPAVYDVGGLPPLGVSLPLAAVLLEVIRRSGLRPRIAWDGHEVEVVYAVGSLKVPWKQVYFVRERGNQIEIGLENSSIRWEFDHLWLLSKISRRYRSRAGKNERRLSAALEHSRAVRDTEVEGRGRRIDRSLWVFVLYPLTVPLTLWLKAASLA
ncbi:hypothetical protein F9C11_17245 [Amycolatopsis sp. VS8301801F10]|uniref:hypothetical protein n=1 Tax=unclassified Amycolatopsis TaxID=2618356 RepID=UPI0038FCC7CE